MILDAASEQEKRINWIQHNYKKHLECVQKAGVCERKIKKERKRGKFESQKPLKTTELTCHGTNCFGLYVAEPNHLELQV